MHCPKFMYPRCGRKRECAMLEKTGAPPGMLQDDCRPLSIWLANRIDSRRHAREAAASIRRAGGAS